MNASLRDLATRAAAVPAPHLDASAVVETAESRLRRRRLLAVVSVTAAVIVIVGTALLVAPDNRDAAPPPAGPDQKNTAPDNKDRGPDTVQTGSMNRLLTYSVGTTIHWGERTIDVRQQTNRWPGAGKLVDYVDATDVGAVFVTGQAPVRDEGGFGVPAGAAAVWFTDGSAPVRIGTTSGSRVRGFGIAPTVAGSTLAWIDPGTGAQTGAVVVYDAAQMEELARLGDADAVPLAVYDDVVYWSPDGGSCDRLLWGAMYGCERTARVMRFDTASGRQSPVSMADYQADRRARPGLFTGPSDDRQIRRGVMFLSFVRHGNRLVAGGIWEAGTESEFTASVTTTGQPVRLRLPPSDRNLNDLKVTQWLDPDRVVLVANDSSDRTGLLVCRLSTGGCQMAVRSSDVTAPGPVVSHG